MRYEEMYVSGLGSWLPPAMDCEEVIRRGLCDPATAQKSDVLSVTVASGDEAPPEMAARAATTAIERAGTHPEDIHLVLHATVFDQGHELWSSAAYVQRAAVGNRCPAMEVRQSSNGGLASIDLAASYLLANPLRSGALVTAADRFRLPDVDRWRSDPGTVYADGGTALILSTRGGFARLRSLALVSEPELEGMHRAGPPFGTVHLHHDQPVELDGYKRRYVEQVGMSSVMSRIKAGQQRALDQTLAEAELDLCEVDWVVLPHFGRRRLESNYLRHMKIDLDRTTCEWSRRIGHLGAGDQMASLEHLVVSGQLQPGHMCLLLGVGSGFTWAGCVVEMLETPKWAAGTP